MASECAREAPYPGVCQAGLGKEVAKVVVTFDLIEGEVSITNSLLNSKALGIEMPHFAQSLS